MARGSWDRGLSKAAVGIACLGVRLVMFVLKAQLVMEAFRYEISILQAFISL